MSDYAEDRFHRKLDAALGRVGERDGVGQFAAVIRPAMVTCCDDCRDDPDGALWKEADAIAAHVLASDWLAQRIEQAKAEAWERGVRQAIEWLRADYEYGAGPDWRENGCEWIADRLAEHRIEAPDA